GLLRLLQGAGGADVAEVERRAGGQVGVAGAVPGGQAGQPAADLGGGVGGARAAAVAADALVGGEADQDGPAGGQRRRVAAPGEEDVAEARVVVTAEDVLLGPRRLQQRGPPLRA